MAFVPFIDTGKVCIDMTLAGGEVSICLHFHKTGATPTDYQALATNMAFQTSDWVNAQITNDLTVNEVTVIDLTSSSSPEYTSTLGLPLSGSNADDTIPAQTNWVASYKTAKRGRSYRGRSYVVGLDELSVVNSQVTAVALLARLVEWSTYITNVEGLTGWTQVVASRQEDGVVRSLGVVTPVTDTVATIDLGTQRRRGIKS